MTQLLNVRRYSFTTVLIDQPSMQSVCRRPGQLDDSVDFLRKEALSFVELSEISVQFCGPCLMTKHGATLHTPAEAIFCRE